MSKVYSDINLGILSLNLSNQRILDVGCASGLLGAQLKSNGNFVYGIDSDVSQLKIASKQLDVVKRIDITKPNPNLPRDFDVIIFADVLEHIYDPAAALKEFCQLLAPGGQIVISLPNIACINVRLGLLLGQFNYQDYGVLDKTHIRFFTLKSARELVEKASFKIIKIDVTPFFSRSVFRFFRSLSKKASTNGDFEKNALNSKAFAFYRRWIFPLERALTRLWPGLLAYQFILIIQPKGNTLK